MTIECDTFESIGYVFEKHFRNKEPVWIKSKHLDFLEGKVLKSHFRIEDNTSCVYFDFRETNLSKKTRQIIGYLVAGLGTTITLPIWLICSLVIPLESPGSVFYIDKRAGQDNKPIKFFKFRTMKENDHLDKERLEMRKKAFQSCLHPQKDKNDSRITKFGKWIRKTSIDELPQLLHVFEGTLDLVGPRAYKLDETEHMHEWQKKRLIEKPGITGFWQTHGRSNTSFNQGVLMDFYYLANRNVLLDLVYLAKTPIVMISGEGSY